MTDIFQKLEEKVATYLSEGKFMLFGDFNARTANRDDFIIDDILNCDVLQEVAEIHTYRVDNVLPVRINPNNTVNDFGLKLRSLCKSSGLRILNGRHKLKMDTDFSSMGVRGLSVVNYCKSTPDIFKRIDKFIVSSFTTWSDHAPLHIQFQTFNLTEDKPTKWCNVSQTLPGRTFK